MTVLLTEPVVAALVQRLTDNLGAAIDQVNGEATDEITVRYPLHILDHLPVLQEITTGVPIVGVGEGPGRFEDDTGHSMTGRYTLAVCVYESDATHQVLATRLRRLRLAVMRTVIAGRVLATADGTGIAANGIRPLTLIAGDIIADTVNYAQPVKSFTGWCGVGIECLTDENT